MEGGADLIGTLAEDFAEPERMDDRLSSVQQLKRAR